MSVATGEASPPLQMWTIYAHPADFPSVPYVVRGWVILDGQPVPNGALGFADTLDQARGYLPPGLVRIERSPDEDPVILETWL